MAVCESTSSLAEVPPISAKLHNGDVTRRGRVLAVVHESLKPGWNQFGAQPGLGEPGQSEGSRFTKRAVLPSVSVGLIPRSNGLLFRSYSSV